MYPAFILKQALKQTRSVCLRASLARNKRVDAYGARDLRASLNTVQLFG